ncbi:MAG: CidA/LrgA family protein [Gammaproteobacteria bacterium]|nr:CidA/LrgA family protein [Gammaproteobacteria bacterium]MBU1722972.1 CidA/LrgA family protein [Gammaproteobacteria bacterium]MBU2007105.1 CidA/LrgA family protein [Gammaproteobacteria bacterium]
MSPDFLTGITILLVYQLVGEVSSRLLQLPVPGPVVGMVLLFCTLLLRGNLEKTLDTASSALLSHLSLLFVPAGVGVIVHFGKIRGEWLPITAALLLSAIITLAATALIMQGVSRLLGHKGDEHEQ